MEEVFSSNHNGDGFPSNHRFFSSRDLLDVVFRRKRIIVLSFAGLLAGALLAIVLLPATYQAEMKLLAERERVDPVVSPNSNVMEQDRSVTQNEVSSEVELFQSRDSLEKTVVDCGLSEPKGFAAVQLRLLEAIGLAPDRDARIYQAVLKLEKNLVVMPINDSNVIKVTYEAHSPQLAAQVLKELSDLYLAKHAALHNPAGTSQFFDQQAQQYKSELSDSLTQLVSFNDRTGVVSADFQKQVTLQKLSDSSASLEKTRADIAGTKERLHKLQVEETSVSPRLTTQIRVSDNPQLLANLRSTLLNLELRRTELLEKYDPSYPLVGEVEKEIVQSRAALVEAEKGGDREETTDQDPTHQWIRTEIAKAKADLVDLSAQAQAMSQAVNTLQSDAVRLDRASVVQQDLLRTAKANEEDFLLYHRKREEARIADALDQRQIINAAIAEVPTVPWVPTGLPTGVKFFGSAQEFGRLCD